jgi:hypothetical protein
MKQGKVRTRILKKYIADVLQQQLVVAEAEDTTVVEDETLYQQE